MSLHVSHFMETANECGLRPIKTTQSREYSEPMLNDFMDKYVTADYTDRSFLQTAETLKRFSRNWEKIPDETKNEFLKIFKFSPKKEKFEEKEPKPEPKLEENIILLMVISMILGYIICMFIN